MARKVFNALDAPRAPRACKRAERDCTVFKSRRTIGISLYITTDHEYKDKVLASAHLGEISRLISSSLRIIYYTTKPPSRLWTTPPSPKTSMSGPNRCRASAYRKRSRLRDTGMAEPRRDSPVSAIAMSLALYAKLQGQHSAA